MKVKHLNSRGAFFLHEDENVLKRDVSGATLEDRLVTNIFVIQCLCEEIPAIISVIDQLIK